MLINGISFMFKKNHFEFECHIFFVFRSHQFVAKWNDLLRKHEFFFLSFIFRSSVLNALEPFS